MALTRCPSIQIHCASSGVAVKEPSVAVLVHTISKSRKSSLSFYSSKCLAVLANHCQANVEMRQLRYAKIFFRQVSLPLDSRSLGRQKQLVANQILLQTWHSLGMSGCHGNCMHEFAGPILWKGCSCTSTNSHIPQALGPGPIVIVYLDRGLGSTRYFFY